MQDCIFCKIVKKELPAFIFYEDESVIGFLDINPLVEGHTLVVPKTHYESIFDIDEEALQKIISVSQKISKRIKEALRVEGVNLINASGVVAGQSVPHFHLHIIPRKAEDEINLASWWRSKVKEMDKEKLKELAEKLKI